MERYGRRLHYVDLFCGAGGTTTGVEQAHIDGVKCADVIACVNHDPHAIASHLANHPGAKHYTEDIRTLDVTPLAKLCDKVRANHPGDYIVLWASLECTNFSKAKGGQPRDADSRTLADHLFRYIEAIKPDYIEIENVEEFMCWGELDASGRPISKDKGKCYIKWINAVKKYGYNYDYRLLNAADFGAYTSRKRFFGLFAKYGLPIVFPEQTHAKNGDDGTLFTHFKRWKPVREVLDLDDEGESIFGRKKPLCEATLARIYAGLIKFVAGGQKAYDAWILKYNSMKQGNYCPPSIDEPCPTVATQNRLGLVKCKFLSKYFGGTGHNISVDEPAGAITTKDHHSFVSVHYSKPVNRSIEEPCPTVTTQDRLELITSQFIANDYSGGGQHSSIESVAPAILTNPKQRLITCKPWLMNTNFKNVGSSLDKPSPVITANRKHQYLMNPQFASAGSSLDKPCFTLIAKMDKRPPYLVSSETGTASIVIYEDDSPNTRKIKEFMAAYNIIDIKMRMLNIQELKRIMGFPQDYTLVGNQSEQKKFIGNAVEVGMSKILCETLYRNLCIAN